MGRQAGGRCIQESLRCPLSSHPPQFCLAYKRTTEFRRLCDIVRNHLANLLK